MSDYDYVLPPELIAQVPLADRSASRLLDLERGSGDITHRSFSDLPDLLREGDLLVLNDSRVLPGRITARRGSGGEVEFLLLREIEPRRWQALIKPARRLRIGEQVIVRARNETALSDAFATLVHKGADGGAIVELDEHLASNLQAYGRVPLPPYIREHLDDDERYQTVYASDVGSAAAPTAGLHFTPEMLVTLSGMGVEIARVTLHVGLDTFRPVTVEYAGEHRIHSEWCAVPESAARAIATAKAAGNRVIAVGTTAARTLETYGAQADLPPGEPYTGMTSIYITPGHSWTMVDAMITNFHLPKSTLLLMMSSFVGKSRLLDAYKEAIDRRYRFFSFGDAMFVH
jgi:S-adenosylmethionine:tRNA ribosyltransferase-isomerase